MSNTVPAAPTLAERLEKNHDLFDDAGNEIWRLTVYDPVHGGWGFLNIGGRAVLDHLGARAGLTRDSAVLELCCGLGDGCCYLASRFGCRVTGVDINARQLAHARRRAAARFPSLAGRVQFIHGDALTWRPGRRFDAVLGMDSLMYLPDRPSVLASARGALRPRGTLVLAEVLAGPNLDDAARHFMWDKEGVTGVPTPREQARMLEDAGFKRLAPLDLTPLAVACFETICRATREQADALVELEGEQLYRERVRENEIYRDFYKNGTLVYFMFSADA